MREKRRRRERNGESNSNGVKIWLSPKRPTPLFFLSFSLSLPLSISRFVVAFHYSLLSSRIVLHPLDRASSTVEDIDPTRFVHLCNFMIDWFSYFTYGTLGISDSLLIIYILKFMNLIDAWLLGVHFLLCMNA